LDDIDALLGTASGNPGVDGTHEARLDILTSASSNHEQRVTALESWKTSHLGDFSNYSSEVNANLQLLNNKTKNLDAFDSDTFFIIDNENNVIAYIDSTGIVTTDLTTKGFKYNNETKKYILDSNGDFNSVNSKLVELLNNVIDLQNVDTTHNARLTSIENQLANVSNVMDFIGAFTTLSDLNAYLNPNNGDVAIVTNTATEYVYVTDKGWVELGNSTATSTAIANLQSVIGHEGGLNSGEANHHMQLAEHETEITNLQNW